MQVELRHRESDQGDLDFNFDPKLFNPDFTRSLDHDTARVGLRYSPTPNSDLLFSYIASDLRDQQSAFPGFTSLDEDKGLQLKSQYIYTGERLNVVMGFGDTNVDRSIGLIGVEPNLEQIDHLHGYLYTNVKLPAPVTWTLGVAYDAFEHDPIQVNKVSPKLGVRWDITNNLSVRRRRLPLGQAAIDCG